MPAQTESTTAAGAANLRWTAASGATGYNVYRNDVKVNATPRPSTATTYADTTAGLGDHSYVLRAVEANGIESVNSNVSSVTIAAPARKTIPLENKIYYQPGLLKVLRHHHRLFCK